MARATLLTADQFFDLPEKPGTVAEVLEGRLIEMPRPSFEHNAIMLRCGKVLLELCETQFPDLLVSGGTEFVLGAGSVLASDLVVLQKDVYESAEKVRGALRCVPNLAIEIVSPRRQGRAIP